MAQLLLAATACLKKRIRAARREPEAHSSHRYREHGLERIPFKLAPPLSQNDQLDLFQDSSKFQQADAILKPQFLEQAVSSDGFSAVTGTTIAKDTNGVN